MTIEVQIKNNDSSRTVQIEQLEFVRGKPGDRESVRHASTIPPGKTGIYHVHLLRELRVTEVTP